MTERLPVLVGKDQKFDYAVKLAKLHLPGLSGNLAVLLLYYLNIYDAVCFPGVETLSEDLDVPLRSIGRYLSTLERAHIIKSATRRGSAVRWFPEIVDMTPDEARAHAKAVQERWKARRRANALPLVAEHLAIDLPNDGSDGLPLGRAEVADPNSLNKNFNLTGTPHGKVAPDFKTSRDDYRAARAQLKASVAADQDGESDGGQAIRPAAATRRR
jgi:hypothetical protein